MSGTLLYSLTSSEDWIPYKSLFVLPAIFNLRLFNHHFKKYLLLNFYYKYGFKLLTLMRISRSNLDNQFLFRNLHILSKFNLNNVWENLFRRLIKWLHFFYL